jgi:DNA-binding NtrC family response regulator
MYLGNPEPRSFVDALVGLTAAQVERELILSTLNSHGGNRTHAARTLGISLRTLRNKLTQYASEGIAINEIGANAP